MWQCQPRVQICWSCPDPKRCRVTVTGYGSTPPAPGCPPPLWACPLMPVTVSPLGPAEIFTSHRPPPSQTQLGYQDPSCFLPMAEPLFSSGGSLMGARGLPASPEAQLPPGTLLQVSGIPACSPRLTGVPVTCPDPAMSSAAQWCLPAQPPQRLPGL